MNKNTHSKQPYCSHFGGLFNISIIKLISNNARFSNRLTNLQTSPEMQRYCSNNVVSPQFEHGDNFHEVCKFASEPIGTYGNTFERHFATSIIWSSLNAPWWWYIPSWLAFDSRTKFVSMIVTTRDWDSEYYMCVWLKQCHHSKIFMTIH